MIVTFVLSLLIMYASGCLIPSAFLPDILRRVSTVLPGSQIKSCIFWQFGQDIAASDFVWLLAEAFLLIGISLFVGTCKKKTACKSDRNAQKERSE